MRYTKDNIESEIQGYIASFVSKINTKIKKSVYNCEGYWPSLGIVDLYTFSLRYKSILNDKERSLYKEAVSYICLVISNIWDNLQIKHKIFTDEMGQVSISYSFEDKDYVLPVEEIVYLNLSSQTGMLSVDDTFERPYSFDCNFIPVLTYSILAGLSPALPPTPWKQFGSDAREHWLVSIEKEIAKSISSWFAIAYPKLELAQVPELYLNGLIRPLFLSESNQSFTDSVRRFFVYCTNLSLPSSYIQELVRAFSICPDEQIGIHSLALAGVFKDINDVPASIYSNAKIYRYAAPFIGDALSLSLSNSGVNGNWLSDPTKESSEMVYKFECALGVHPWLILPYERIRNNQDPELREFLELVHSFYYEEAGRKLMSILENNPADIDLRLQHIKFEVLRGDFEYAHQLCKTLISEPGAENNGLFFNVWGLCLLELGEPDLAARYFRAAKNNSQISPDLKSDVMNNLAWANIQLGMMDQAKPLLLEAEHLSSSPLTIYLNLAYIFSVKKDVQSQNLYLERAMEIAPFDRRVFANIIN